MTTDVHVEVIDAPYDSKAVSGISITYGYNMIPFAKVSLNAPYIQTEIGKEFICSPEKFKKRTKPTIFKIQSTAGCLTFTGFFDGMSAQQTVGGIEYTAIYKSQFQRLLEILPKFLGLMPSSFNPFKSVEALKIIYGNPELQFTDVKLGAVQLNTNLPFSEYLIEVFRKMLVSQKEYGMMTQTRTQNSLIDLIKAQPYQDNVIEAQELLKRFNTDNILAYQIPAAQSAEALINLIFSPTVQSLWDMLLSCMDFLGCLILVGDNKTFVIPRANFLKAPDMEVPLPKALAQEPNQAFPAEYNNFVVNDNGYANVRACFVAATDDTSQANIKYQDRVTNSLGMYPPKGQMDPDIGDDGSSGIVLVSMEEKMLNSLMFGFASEIKTQANLEAGKPYSEVVINTPWEIKALYDTKVKVEKTTLDTQIEILDQFAKIRFLEEKYTGRTGSFTSVFNPEWVPGTTGTLYTRFPGLFFEFFVTAVQHDLIISAPNTGSMVTSVSFDSVRSSSKTPNIPGVKVVELFKYNKEKMKGVQKMWTADIAGVKKKKEL